MYLSYRWTDKDGLAGHFSPCGFFHEPVAYTKNRCHGWNYSWSKNHWGFDRTDIRTYGQTDRQWWSCGSFFRFTETERKWSRQTGTHTHTHTHTHICISTFFTCWSSCKWSDPPLTHNKTRQVLGRRWISKPILLIHWWFTLLCFIKKNFIYSNSRPYNLKKKHIDVDHTSRLGRLWSDRQTNGGSRQKLESWSYFIPSVSHDPVHKLWCIMNLHTTRVPLEPVLQKLLS